MPGATNKSESTTSAAASGGNPLTTPSPHPHVIHAAPAQPYEPPIYTTPLRIRTTPPTLNPHAPPLATPYPHFAYLPPDASHRLTHPILTMTEPLPDTNSNPPANPLTNTNPDHQDRPYAHGLPHNAPASEPGEHGGGGGAPRAREEGTGHGSYDAWSNIRQDLAHLAPRLTTTRCPPSPLPPPLTRTCAAEAGGAGAIPSLGVKEQRRLIDVLLDAAAWPDASAKLPLLPAGATVIATPGLDLTALDLYRFRTPPPSDPAAAYLTDAAIDFALLTLSKEQSLPSPRGLYVLSPTFVAVPTATMQSLLQGRSSISLVARRVASHILSLGSTTHLLIPLNLGALHWSLCAVDLAQRTVHTVDSLQTQFTAQRQQSTELVRELALEVNKLTNRPQGPWLCAAAETLQQANGYDCAIHVIVNCIVMTSACRVSVSTAHIQRARRWLLWEMLKHLPAHATHPLHATTATPTALAPLTGPPLTRPTIPTHLATTTTPRQGGLPSPTLNPLATPFQTRHRVPHSRPCPTEVLPTAQSPPIIPTALTTSPTLNPLAPPSPPTLPPSTHPPTPPLRPPIPAPPPTTRLIMPPLDPSTPSAAPTTPVLSLNVGPTGVRESLQHLLPLFTSNPGVVLLQDVKLTAKSAVSFKSWAHQMLPEYAVFIKSTLRPKSDIKVATLVHHGLAARGTQLPIYPTSATTGGVSMPELASRVQFIRTVDVHTEVVILWVNTYQYQADEAEKQQALLDLVNSMLDVWAPKVHHVVWGGDFNASLRARTGYVRGTLKCPTAQEQADARLATWLRARTGLTPCLPEGATWSSPNGSREATLDFFFLSKGLGRLPCAAEDSPEIRHDHKVISILLDANVISPLPHHWDIFKPKRLRMTEWKAKREEWAQGTGLIIQSLPADVDPLTLLASAEKAARDTAATVLGVSGGHRNTLIPFHSERFRKLTALLRIVKSARKDIAQRCQGTVAAPPSKSMRAAWDRGIVPDGARVAWASLANLPYGHEQNMWAKEWLSTLRDRTALTSQQLRDLRHAEITESVAQSRLAAIARMARPGAKEVRRLLNKSTPAVSSPYLATSYPDTVLVRPQGDSQLLRAALSATLESAASTISIEPLPDGEGTGHAVRVGGIPPSRLHAVLTVCSGERVSLLSTGTQHVHTPPDKLVVWESHLAKEADATRTRCGGCHALGPVPISDNAAKRGIKHWCPTCADFCQPQVDPADYDEFPFSTAATPRIAADATETLRGVISREDLVYRISQLSRGKAPGEDGFVYEFLKDGPPSLIDAVLEAVNALLTRQANVPHDWKGCIIRLLYKKGNPMDCRNFRPVVLLNAVYKVYTAIVTDRLYRISEKHNLLSASQEGFRRHHSTARQAQSLLWAYETARERGDTLVVAFLDFQNAFNSIDHAALWMYLRLIGVPDVDMLEDIYAGSRYKAQTSYGTTAEVSLTRGAKQGDTLSPLLFSLLFNPLLLALEAAGLGQVTLTGLRTAVRAFADDATLTTKCVEDMQVLVAIVDRFCTWSGMRLNVSKSEVTGFNFKLKCELDVSDIRVGGQALQRLAPKDAFRYLGFRFSLTGDFTAEVNHIMQGVADLKPVVFKHSYLTEQMTAVMSSITVARFRYSAALVPWTAGQLKKLYQRWTMIHKLAYKLPAGLAGAIFNLPASTGACPLAHPRVALLQALTQHIEALVVWDDDLRAQTRLRYKRLCTRYGCQSAEELHQALSDTADIHVCPIARLIQLSSKLGVTPQLPGVVTDGAHEDTGHSWHGLKTRITGHVRGLEDRGDDTTHLRSGLIVWDRAVLHLTARGYPDPSHMSLKTVRGHVMWAVPPVPKRCTAFRVLLERLGHPQAGEGRPCPWSLPAQPAPRAGLLPSLGEIIDRLATEIRIGNPTPPRRADMLQHVAGEHEQLLALHEAAADPAISNVAFGGLLYGARVRDPTAPTPARRMRAPTRMASAAVQAVRQAPWPLRNTIRIALLQLAQSTPTRPEITIDWQQWRLTVTDESWDTALAKQGITRTQLAPDTDDEGEGNEGGTAGGSGDTGGVRSRIKHQTGQHDAILGQFYELLADPRVDKGTLHALFIRLVTGLEPVSEPVSARDHDTGPPPPPPGRTAFEEGGGPSEGGGADHPSPLPPPPPPSPPPLPEEEDVPLDARLITFVTEDVTESSVRIGPFRITTKASVSRIDKDSEEGSEHWVTMGQARLAFLLSTASDATALLRRIKQWGLQTDADEAEGCCLSAQAWTKLQSLTEANLLIGAQPITAGSAFLSAWTNTRDREGWNCADGADQGVPPLGGGLTPLISMLSMEAEMQEQTLSWLEAQATGNWFALTRARTATRATVLALRGRGRVGGVLRKDLPCLQRRGSWHTCGLRTSDSREEWTLWIGPDVDEQTIGRIRAGLRERDEEWSGAQVPRPASLTWREHRLGPGAPFYDRPGVVLATDGSVLADGRMGTAATGMDGRVQRREVDGLPSSLRAELCGLLLAAKETPLDEALTVLTDSLGSIQTLQPLTRHDFRVCLRRHPHRTLIREVMCWLRRRTAPTLIAKIRAHRGEPLNEAADTAANAAVPADPLPLVYDPLVVYFRYAGLGPRVWGAGLKAYLAKTAAEQWQKELTRHKVPRDQPPAENAQGLAPRLLNVTETWLLRNGQGREILGAALAALPNGARKRRVLQTVGNSFPTQMNLYRWNISKTAICCLCHSAHESLAHLQCWCPALSEARIKAHHSVWRGVWSAITEREVHDWTFAIEATAQTLAQLPAPREHALVQEEWQRKLRGLTDDDSALDDAEKDSAFVGLGQLAAQLVGAADQSMEQRYRMIEESGITKLHQCAGILLTAEAHDDLDAVLRQIEAERRELRAGQDILRKRPDGFAIHWLTRRFYVLEYTRAYDGHCDGLEKADAFKTARYGPLLRALEQRLGGRWTGTILALSTGVKGSINDARWHEQLGQLGLTKAQSTAAINKAVVATLEALDVLYTARATAWATAH